MTSLDQHHTMVEATLGPGGKGLPREQGFQEEESGIQGEWDSRGRMSNTEGKHGGSTHLVPGTTLSAFCDSDAWTLPTSLWSSSPSRSLCTERETEALGR